ncbi:MAG: hypothetical protein ACYDG2_03905 [Ruminiclostridium sp.]
MYIQNAQNAAVGEALDDAGFGIQFCDVSKGPDMEPVDEGTPLLSMVVQAQQSSGLDGAEVPALSDAADLLESSQIATTPETPEAQELAAASGQEYSDLQNQPEQEETQPTVDGHLEVPNQPATEDIMRRFRDSLQMKIIRISRNNSRQRQIRRSPMSLRRRWI